MRIIQLLIEYDGTDFSGLQSQPGQRTVQGTIEDTLSRVLGHKVVVAGASRTDAGVHALGQVAHFRTTSGMTCFRLQGALDGLLPPDVAVRSVKEVAATIDPQRLVKRKTYRYLIWNDRIRSPLLRERAWHVWNPLDLRAMRRAARCLVGRHDFSAFRATRSETKTSIRRMDRIVIGWEASGLPGRKCLALTFTAGGFLKHMIRNVVGTLVEIGEGRRLPEDMEKILRSRDRRQAGRAAPAHGLCLVSGRL